MNSPSAPPFQPAPENYQALQRRRGGVAVWSLELDLAPEVLDSESKLLDQEERERAQRFKFDIDRNRFIAAHAGLRRILSKHLDCTPSDLRFGTAAGGKPELAPLLARGSELPHPVHFNLSHSQGRALFAVSPDLELGVDLEYHRDVEVLPLAERFFTPREKEHIERAEGANKPTEFFRIWTRKEALHKCLGLGLTLKLDSFDLCGAQSSLHVSAESLAHSDPSRSLGGLYSLHQIELGSDLSACLACRGMPQQIHCWSLGRAT